MTDEQIIKALECMLGKYSIGELMDCHGCVFETQDLCYENASEGLVKFALALINRQKEEIERLEHIRAELSKEADRIAEEHSDLIVEKDELFDIAENALKGMREANALFPKVQAKARAEAVKEFVEMLKEYTHDIVLYGEIVTMSRINNLVKEFTEEKT